jgi:ATP-dependent RNA helicase DeaD
LQNFTDLNLSPALLRAIQELGYEKPSPIQAETLPILLGEATDFIGLAATGTGKTAAFSIPLLERIDTSLRRVQALVLCPTRELALQVAGQINLLGKYKGVRSVAVYGGSSYNDQIAGLRSGAQIVVGTPGRVIDHLERGTLVLDDLKLLVLDEADEMFSMGFKEEIESVLEKSPRDSSNIWLFSATMEREVRRVVDNYLRDPKQVAVNRKEMLSATVEQFYYPTRESDKPEILCKLIEAAEDFYGVIFCQTKSLVADLTSFLMDRGYKVDCLHGDKDQNSRERTMQAFRDRKITVLICTDVAARGLDVKDITHVVNYSLPREMDNYVHRIGRTARSGKAGIAMNLVTPSHRNLMYRIEQMTKTRMKEGVIPSRREIATKKVAKLLGGFREQPFHTRAMEIMSDEWREQLSQMSAEQVAAHFMTLIMPDVFIDKERPARRPEDNGDRPRNRRPERSGEGGDRRDSAPRGRRDFDRDGGGRGGSRSYDRGPRDEQRGRGGPRPPRFEARANRKFDSDESGFESQSSAPTEALQAPRSEPRAERRTEPRSPRPQSTGFERRERGPREFAPRGKGGFEARGGVEGRGRFDGDRQQEGGNRRPFKRHAEGQFETQPRERRGADSRPQRLLEKPAASTQSRKLAAAEKKPRWEANDSLITPNRRARRAAMFANEPKTN